ncbi:hypothetical protein HDU85_000985 [Gaertneriomyces sp. JEL0708]|nr:hypothetical protein HDU85_000985 [Gaertneriomyces sp. JEL0708]
MSVQTRSLVSFAHVDSVERSIEFYADLGFKAVKTVIPEGQSAPVWAWLQSEQAKLMVGLASEPVVASQQAVLFYLYVDDIEQTHAALTGLGHSPGEIKRPFYMPHGECRLEDPDGAEWSDSGDMFPDKIDETVVDYSARLGVQPCVVVASEYALSRTESLNVSVRQDLSCDALSEAVEPLTACEPGVERGRGRQGRCSGHAGDPAGAAGSLRGPVGSA